MADTTLTLKIKNYKAVKNATISIDSITVLSGVNASGKSSIAHLFHTITNIDATYHLWVRKSLYNKISNLVSELYSFLKRTENLQLNEAPPLGEATNEATNDIDDSLDDFLDNSFVTNFSNNLFKRPFEDTIEELENYIKEMKEHQESPNYMRALKFFVRALSRRDRDITENNFKDIILKKLHDLKIENQKLLKSRDYKVFNSLPREILRYLTEDGEVELKEGDFTIYHTQKEKTSVTLQKSSNLQEIFGLTRSIYIESPWTSIPTKNTNETLEFNDKHLYLSPEKKDMSCENSLFNVLNGSIDSEEYISGIKWQYNRDGGLPPIDLEDCATGIKSLAILNILYQHAYLDEKTLLIIDEPEAHLHPQWIVEYARILVLLVKNLHVRLLLTSHDPDMISALQRITEVEHVDGINFYLAERSNNDPYMFNYRHLGKDIEPIFDAFNVAIDNIDTYPDKQ